MLQEALRQERYVVSSLRSERLTFLANVDNMNSMFDVARKLTRSAAVFAMRVEHHRSLERAQFLSMAFSSVLEHFFIIWFSHSFCRERQDVLEQRWVAASRLNTLLEKRIMQQDMQGHIWFVGCDVAKAYEIVRWIFTTFVKMMAQRFYQSVDPW
jgi:hypothetical protein